MAAAERFSFFYPSKFWLNRRRQPGPRYEPLVGEDIDDELSPPADIMVSQPSHGGGGDAGAMGAGAMAKQVLRKIDRRLIPLLFVTYALNFMDKTILSSASVFGLKDDTVRPIPDPYASMHPRSTILTTANSISKDKTTAGCRPSSILDISPGHIPPLSSSPASLSRGT